MYKRQDKNGNNGKKEYSHKQFYELEKKKVNGKYKDMYIQYVSFLYGKNEMNEECTGILNLKSQLTFDQFCILKDKISIINNKKGEQKVIMQDMLMAMHNEPKYIKGNEYF